MALLWNNAAMEAVYFINMSISSNAYHLNGRKRALLIQGLCYAVKGKRSFPSNTFHVSYGAATVRMSEADIFLSLSSPFSFLYLSIYIFFLHQRLLEGITMPGQCSKHIVPAASTLQFHWRG